ncbi:MAG: dTDP-4-dehydrorhamnose 3,5-epimerase family protein, partial [Clostridiales bacterium]
PTGEDGIMWNDKDLAIDWHLEKGMEISLSDKDKKNHSFKAYCEGLGR